METECDLRKVEKMTTVEMVAEWLREHGCTGLWRTEDAESDGCQCGLEDLAWCEHPHADCYPIGAAHSDAGAGYVDIVRMWLRMRGYDGLYDGEGCDCALDELIRCEHALEACMPGVWWRCPECDARYIGPRSESSGCPWCGCDSTRLRDSRR